MTSDHFHFLNSVKKEWLTNSDSLTQRLRNLTNNKIKLELCYDNWGDANLLYRDALMLSQQEKTWIRRIKWCYEAQTWLSCIVVIPESSVTNDTQELIQIGNGSIGDVIFKDLTLTRSPFLFHEKEAEIEKGSITRYSILHYKKKPLLVVETFLPTFLVYLDELSKN